MMQAAYDALIRRGGAALAGRQYVTVQPWHYSPTEEVARLVLDATLPGVAQQVRDLPGYGDPSGGLVSRQAVLDLLRQKPEEER